jgi:hypothetical protein
MEVEDRIWEMGENLDAYCKDAEEPLNRQWRQRLRSERVGFAPTDVGGYSISAKDVNRKEGYWLSAREP